MRFLFAMLLECLDFVETLRETFGAGRDALLEGTEAVRSEFRLQRANRAQTNLTGLMIGILISAIVAIQVFIPVVQDSIANSNVSGTEATILGLLPLFAALLLLIALASPLMQRF